MNKVVDVIDTLIYGKNPIKWKGTVSENENFVVSAIIRTSVGDEKIKDNGVRIQMIARVDITVSLWNKENQKQGLIIIPYIAGRMMRIVRTDNTASVFFTADDNDSSRAFKNLILHDEIHKTIELEVSRVMVLFNERAKEGKQLVEIENTLEGANEFIKHAITMDAKRKANSIINTQNTEKQSSNNADEETVNQILNM